MSLRLVHDRAERAPPLPLDWHRVPTHPDCEAWAPPDAVERFAERTVTTLLARARWLAVFAAGFAFGALSVLLRLLA